MLLRICTIIAIAWLAACSSGEELVERPGCADVIDATVEATDPDVYTIAVTVSSADTGWEKYADLWEVRTPQGEVLAERVLAHPHVDEQPFIRSLSGVHVPAGIEAITIAARDSVEGFCGAELTVAIPR